MISSKKGKLYFRLLIAAAFLFIFAFALYTLAANPSAFPSITSRTLHSPQNRVTSEAELL